MNMLEVYYQLFTLADKIGNGASVSVSLDRRSGLEDFITFRVDWQDDNHFMTRFSLTRFLVQQENVSQIIIYTAQREYSKLSNK